MFKSLSRWRNKQARRARNSREKFRGLLLEQLESRQLLTAITSITETASFNITGNVGEKPESKIWTHGGKWWGVFSDTVGSHLYRLDGTTWNQVLQLSADTSVKVDAKSQGNVAHVLFENNLNSKLISLQYVPGPTPTYQLWSERPTAAAFPLAEYVESATLDIDTTGRMWIAHDDQISAVDSTKKSTIKVRYSDAPYTTISDPIILDPEIFYDDISQIIAMPGGKIGVFWNNQKTKQFAFRTHADGTDPTVWTPNEAPGAHMTGRFSDDHLNLKVASDGTLYAAIKTSYDLDPNPWMGMLIRRPNGVWDNFYPLVGKGTRPNLQLNEAAKTFIVSYDDDFNWAYQECSTVTIVCQPAKTLLAVGRNATATKQNVTKEAVILVSGKSTSGAVNGAIVKFNVPNTAPTVDAGPNQTIFAAQTANLKGFATDDALPDPPNSLTTTWTKVVGPGVVTFGNTSRQETTASFSAEGAYTLRLTASDGTLTSFDDVSIIVGTTPANQAPTVTVGQDLIIGIAQAPLLDGTVLDDGLPFNPGTTTKLWTKVSGPGTANFATPTAEDTTVTFNAIGTYTLRLTAFDGQFTASDDIVVTVNLLPPNQAPVVNAGPDQTIIIGSNATLNGSFTDDGQAVPVNSVVTNWSKVSGPGTVAFLNTSTLNTAANFSQAGTYVLALTANDTELIGQDTVTITVLETPPSQTMSFQDGVAPTATYIGTRDTKLRSDQTTTMNGLNNKLEVDGSPDISSIIKWDISAIPADSVITGAGFTVNVVNTTTQSFKIYEMLKPWVENQATYNLAATGLPWQVVGAAGATDRGSTVVGTITAPTLGLATVQLNAAGLALVQKWVSNPTTNNGLIIQDYADSNTDDVDFNSREITTPTTRPKLVVSYTTIPVNDPPFIGNLAGDILHYPENAAPQVIDQGTPALVTDADSTDFAFGTLTVAMAVGAIPSDDVLGIKSAGDITVIGSDVRYQGNFIGTYAGGSNGNNLVITLNLAASPAAATALVKAITYQNLSHNPSTSQRTVSFVLVDGDGTANGGADTVSVTATINITPINDAPAIAYIESDKLECVENSGPQRFDVDTQAIVADPDSLDFGGGSLTVSLGATGVSTQDVLSISTSGGISVAGNVVSHQGTPIGTFTGGTNGTNLVVTLNSAATPIATSALISALAYENTSDFPSTVSRKISITIVDGDGVLNGGTDTGSATATIEILPINDPPAINNLNADQLSYVEGSGLRTIDQGTAVTATDVDSVNFDTGKLTVSIVSGGVPSEDVLSVKHTGTNSGQIGVNGTTVSFGGVPIGTMSGGLNGSPLQVALTSAATPVTMSALLAAVGYTNASDTPNTSPRTVSFVLTDGDGTVEGGADTATATATVAVIANNDAPVVQNLSGDVLAYLESSGARLLDQNAAAIVSDVDSTDFDGGSLTVSVSSGGNSAQDVLSIATGGDVVLDGAVVKFQGTSIGSVTGGTNGQDLVVSFNSSATPTAASSLLRALVYANTSVAPTTSQRTVTMGVRDGDGTANGGSDSASATVTIEISTINSAPVIANLNGDTLSYIEDAGARKIDQNSSATVSDDDSPNLDSGSLTVSIGAGAVPAEDVLSVLSSGDVSVSGSNITYQNTVIGTLGGGTNGSSLAISFNTAATLPAVSAVIQAIAYTNTSHTPNTAARQIVFMLNDGDGEANGGFSTTSTTTTVTITATNDAPVINSFGGPLTYTENAGPLAINQSVGAGVTDVDSANFGGGSVTVSVTSGGVAAQDLLSVKNVGDISLVGNTVSHQGSAIGTASEGTNGNPLVISLNNYATSSLVSALLHALSYTNVSEAPSTTPRVITVAVTDGDGTANGGTDTGTATTTVQMTAVNDAPIFTGLNGGSSFNEGGSSVAVDADVTLTDFELQAANNHDGMSLSVARQGGSNIDDVFSFQVNGSPGFTVGAGILQVSGSTFATFTNTAGSLTIQFLSGSTTALVNDVLQRIVYANAGAVPPASVTLEYIVNDGNTANIQGTGANPGLTTGTATVLINKLPLISNLLGGATYIEDGAAVNVDTAVQISDTELDGLNNYSGATFSVTRQSGSSIEDVISLASGTVSLKGSDVMVDGTAVATLTQGPVSTLSVAFNANATSSIADLIVQAVTYSTTSQNPPSSVTLRYTFYDGSAQVSSSTTVQITGVNDAPTINNLDGDILAYLENAGALALDQNSQALVPLIDSPDFDTGSLTVSIAAGGSAGEDVLSVRTTGNINLNGSDVSYAGSVIGTVTGGIGGDALVISFNNLATSPAVSALLNAIGYANTSDAPSTAQRIVTLTLNDGDGVANDGVDTAVANVTINITSVNDPPVLTDLANDTLTYTENTGARLIDQPVAAAISDVDSADFAGGSVTVSIVAGGNGAQDILSISPVGDITLDGTTVNYQGTPIGTVSGGTNGLAFIVQLNAAANSVATAALIRSLTYTNNSEAPTTASRVVAVLLDDGDGTANGGNNTGSAPITINIVAVNDAPEFASLNGGAVFNELGSPVVIDADATMNDFELAAANNYAGAVLTILRQGGSNADDQFGFSTSGTPAFTVGSGILQVAGSTFGTFSQNAGELTIQFASGSTHALVNHVLRRITYSNVGAVLPAAVDLTYTLSDGNSANAQGLGDNPALVSGTASVLINRLPVLTNLDGGVTYQEDSSPIAVDTDISVSDLELDTLDNYAGATFTVVRQGGPNSDDVLSVGSLTVSVSGTDVIVGGNTVGILVQGPGATLTISWNSNATAAIANEVLRAVTYANTSQNPPANVTLLYTFNDGFAQVSGTGAIDITPVNDAPEIHNIGTLEYLENSGQQVIDQGVPATATDIDSLNFGGGSLKVDIISGGLATEDILSIRTGGGISFDGVNVSYLGTLIGAAAGGVNGANLIVALNNSATPAAASALLNAVTYRNTSDFPSTTQRLVTFTLTDGDGTANGGTDTVVSTATVNITAVNDAPVMSNLGGDNLTYIENAAPQAIDQSLLAIVSDVDSTDFDGGSFTVSIASGGVAVHDVLSLLNVADVTFDGTTVSHLGIAIGTATGGTNGNPLAIRLNSAATPISLSALVQAIAYSNTSDAPTTTPRVVIFSLNDGGGTLNGGQQIGTATATVQVIAVNDAPNFVDLNSGSVFTEGGAAAIIDSNATIVDPELDAINNYAGAALTIARFGGQNLDDVFGFNTSGSSSFTIVGNELRAGGLTFGTFTHTLGLFFVNFTSLATPATSTLVDEVLQRITYRNNGVSLPTSVTLFMTLSDGNVGAQGTGASPGTDTATPVILINKLPVLANLTSGATYVENGPAVAVDEDVVVSDLELDALNNYAGSSLTVTRNSGFSANDQISLGSAFVSLSGSNVIVGGNTVATLTQGPGSTLTVSFNANATSSIADQVLQAVTYASSDNNPPANVVLRYSFSDGVVATFGLTTISLVPVNDAPAIANLAGDDLGYIVLTAIGNSPPQIIDQGLAATITDVDSVNFDGGVLSVAIGAGAVAFEDSLSMRNAGTGSGQISFNGTTVRYQGIIIGTATGGTNGNNLVITFNAFANAAAVSALLGSITYENTSATPDVTPREVVFSVTDGDGIAIGGSDTVSVTTTVTLRPINDPPVIGNLSGDNLLYTENSSPQRADQGLSATINDPDSANFGGGFLNVAIATGLMPSEDALSISNYGNVTFDGTNVSVSGTPIGTVAGGANGSALLINFNASATVSAVAQLLAAVNYSNTSNAPNTAPRHVVFTLNDGDGTMFGGTDTTSVTSTITVLAVNDGPTLSNVNGSGMFSSGAAPIVLDGDATASDIELAALNNYGGSSITVARHRGANPDDSYGFTASPNFSAVGSELKANGLTFANFTNVDGTLTIHFSSSQTPATESLVNDVLQHVYYQNISPVLPLSVQLAITFSDGNVGNAQGSGANPATATANALVMVNYSPVLLSLNGGSSYLEDGPAVQVDSNAVVADPEMDSLNDYSGATLTATIQGGISGQEILSLGSAWVSVAGTDVKVNGLTVAAVTQGPGTTIAVVFNGNSTSASADRVLQAITYANSSQNPLSNALVDYQFSDGSAMTVGIATVTLVGVNDAPLVAMSSSPTYTENSGPQLIDNAQSAVVSDVDSPNFGGGFVNISITAGGVPAQDLLSMQHTGTGLAQIGFDGSIVSYEGVSIGTATGGINGQPLAIQLTNSASAISVAALLKSITYENTSDVPNLTPRTITIELNDGDGTANGGTNTGYSSATISISPTNDAPTIFDLEGDTLSYTENIGPHRIDQGLPAIAYDVDSVDFASGSLSVAIIAGGVAAQDVLSLLPSGDISTVGTNVLFQGSIIGTISGGTNGSALVISLNGLATLPAVSALLQNVSYEDTSDTPATTTRVVTFTLNDGDGVDVGVVTTAVEFTAVNDPPVINNLGGDVLVYSENSSAGLIDLGAAATVQDIDSHDFNGGSLTVSLLSANPGEGDVLGIQSNGTIAVSGSDVLYQGNVIGTATGGTNGSALVISLNSAATPPAMSALLRRISYQNLSDGPPASRRLAVTLADGDGSANGGSDTAVVTTTVNIISINDAPVIAGLTGDFLTFTENAATQAIDQGVIASISDLDSTDFGGGSLTVAITSGNAAAEDVLSVNTGGTISVVGSNVQYLGTVIGAVSGGTNGTPLVINLNGFATQAAVSALIGAVTYGNAFEAPHANLRTITFTLNDGDGVANGGVAPGTATATISVIAVNDGPVLSNLQGDTLNYEEGSGAVALDQGTVASLTDVDSVDLFGGSLSVAFLSGNVALQDSLTIKPSADITLDGVNVRYQGISFGTFSGGTNGSPILVNFFASANVTSVSALLRAVAYTNSSIAPNTQQRTIVWTVNDGDGTSNGGVNIGTATTTINVLSVNAAPVISNLAGDMLSYLENAGSVQIDQENASSITDVDSADFASGTLTVAFVSGNVASEDRLAIRNIGIGPGQIGFNGTTVSYGGVAIGNANGGTNGNPLVVTLNGFASPAITAALLAAVSFEHTSEDPDASPRVISFTLTDGDGAANGGSDAATVLATVAITAVNDPPVINQLNGDIFSYTENSGAVTIDSGLPATIATGDSENFNSGGLTVSITAGGVAAEDLLSVLPGGNIGVSGSNVTFQGTAFGSVNGGVNATPLTITFNSFATPAAVTDLLRAIAYTNTSTIPTTTARQVTFALNDGGGTANGGANTTSVTTIVSMLPVNAPPIVNDLDGDVLQYVENSGAMVIDQGLATTMLDDDSNNFAGGSVTITIISGGVTSQDALGVRTAGNISVDGNNIRHQGTIIGTVSGGLNAFSLTIALNSAATPTTVADLLRAITYNNPSEAPVSSTRILALSINDGDGTANGGSDTTTVTVTIHVTAVNDVPVLTSLNGTTFTQGGSAVVIDGDVSINDLELSLANDYSGATLEIQRQGGANTDDVMTLDLTGTPGFSIGAGVLQVGASTFAAFSSTAGMFTVQFGAGSTPALVNAVIRRIAYTNVGVVLPASVSLVYTISDGNTGNAQGTGANPGAVTGVSLIAINHLPVLTNLTGGGTYIEDGVPVIVDGGALLSDEELDTANSYAGTSLIISRQGGAQTEDLIGLSSATVSLSGTSVNVGGVTVATLTQGPGSTLALNFNANATSAIADQVLQAVTYSSTNQNPPSTVTLAYVFNDGATQVAGTAIVNITPVNDAPVISNLAGDTLAYFENSGVVSIDQGVAAVVGLLDSPDFGGGSLTVTITTGAVPTEDLLSIRNTASIAISAGNVSHLGTAIGTVSGGTNGAPLVVSLNASATPVAVSAVLNAVGYANSADLPTIAQRLVTFTLNDGDGILNGGADTSTVTGTITVTPANDPPVISNVTGDVLVFLENTTAQLIDQGTAASIVDPDSLDFATGSLTVTITSGGVAAQDVLSIASSGNISITGTTVSHLGTAIGTFSGGTNGTALVVSLNSAANPTNVAALIRAITYTNVSEGPTATPRVVTFALNDGDGVLNGGIAIGSATATVNNTAINDPPTLSNLTGDVLAYVEGTGFKAIDQSAAALVADTDSLDFATGTLTVSIITNGVAAQDVLSIQAMGGITTSGVNVSNQGTVIGTFAGGTNGSNLAISFNTSATPTAVTNLVRAISYQNTSTTPSVLSRTVQFTLKDGDGILNGGLDTATATTTITVTAVDNPTTTSFQNGVFPTTSYSGTQDTKLRSDQATTNLGTNATLEMDGNPDFSSLVKWNVTAIPAGSTVQSASITLNVINTTINSFNIYQMLRPWSESTSTFNVYATGLPWQIAGAQGALDRGTTVLGTLSAAALGSYTVNLNSAGVALVQSWVNNPSTNFGLIFQNYLDANTDDMDVSSSNNSNALLRPKLTIGIASPSSSPLRTSALTTNPSNPFDVNNDSVVTPRDALIVINHLNGSEGEDSLDAQKIYPDVSGDGVVAPLDILLIINFLNQAQIVVPDEVDAEGEGARDLEDLIVVQRSSDELMGDELLAGLSVHGFLDLSSEISEDFSLEDSVFGRDRTTALRGQRESQVLNDGNGNFILGTDSAFENDDWCLEQDSSIVKGDLLASVVLESSVDDECELIFASWPSHLTHDDERS